MKKSCILQSSADRRVDGRGERRGPHHLVRPFLGVGILGGFTTFSTFALDNQHLFAAGRVFVALRPPQSASARTLDHTKQRSEDPRPETLSFLLAKFQASPLARQTNSRYRHNDLMSYNTIQEHPLPK